MGKGTEKGWRSGGGGERLNNRWWWMEIRFTFCLCERWADAVLEGHTTAQSEGSGGKCEGERRGGALSPVCPEDPHVYDGRTPAVSPKPSSQMPGSYCFSPFGCPARGWNTDRYLHWGHSNHSISFPHRYRWFLVVSQNTEKLYEFCTKLYIFFLNFTIVCAQIWFIGLK